MFPEGFLWGAATSSHQVEGFNTNNDWCLWEQQGKTKEPSGPAARHYELFEQDFQLARALGHNAHRFSIEWSRIEPQEDGFDEKAIQHYRYVVRSLRQKSMEPIVTLHHFTHPQWFSKQGGWLNPQAPFWFARYAQKMAEVLGGEVLYWVTVNEPLVLAYYGYLTGIWPPGAKSIQHTWQVVSQLIKSHTMAYARIHHVYRRQGWPAPKVGVAQNLMVFKVCPKTNNLWCRLGVFLRHRLFNLHFLEKTQSKMDFIGVNYYAREYISNDRQLSYGLFGGKCNKVHGHVGHVNCLFWDSCPEGFFEVLGWLKKFKKPILITENGTCEENDELRWQFIKDHLKQLEKAIDAQIPVFGYLYWSLIDNFEWHHGFGPRFGLMEVNYQTFERTPRESAFRFREVCTTNHL
jgi:beta-glucosidase